MSVSSLELNSDPIAALAPLRQSGGEVRTFGLDDDTVRRFVAARSPGLREAIEAAVHQFLQLQTEYPELLAADEQEQVLRVQDHYLNFYPDDAVCPFIALAGRGAWMVTAKGAVLHDSGGYGMLGFGHAPEPLLEAMSRRQVMANIMTPSFSHLAFSTALRKELGHQRGECPFTRFVCINSGSEAVTVAARIADINAKVMTDPGGRHAGKPRYLLSQAGAFHGRTDRPARFSDSTISVYRKFLASFRDEDRLLTIRPSCVCDLREVFERADREGFFIEALFLEPVMGEGNPGKAIGRRFYDEARRLTEEHDTVLMVDSIQAGLRAQGCLSIVDYPGFEDCAAPDMETFSKALQGGQYPLSVLALNERAAAMYRKGVYGNTMTTNPRALDVAVAVLGMIDDDLRENIRARGRELLDGLRALQKELDGAITNVAGTGLLVAAELDPAVYRSYGANSTEDFMRRHGLNIIHGGKNAIRYTPHFAVTSEEIQLLIDGTRQALLDGPRIDA